MRARTALMLTLGIEVGAAVLRQRRRALAWQQAQERAAALHRPLVVIGDPDAGIVTNMQRAYGCGDLCIDLHGAPNCPKSLALDLDRQPIPLATDSAVVYCSCVLEYCQRPDIAWAECLRVAGGERNVFLVTVDPWSLTALWYPGARWIVDRDGSDVKGFQAVGAQPLFWAVGNAGLILAAARNQ